MQCKITFKFIENTILVESFDGFDDCRFGGSVYPDGKYKIFSNKIPSYYIDGEGKKHYFKNYK
ncbi:MAG: hypothetical protein NTW25_16400 [Candidatus Kapabacteria bacterium]|nr:hypothetical protein [Candidatus Kapabacteria bacterium]